MAPTPGAGDLRDLAAGRSPPGSGTAARPVWSPQLRWPGRRRVLLTNTGREEFLYSFKRRAADVLAYFDRPGTSNGPTEAINGRLEHLRGSALGFRTLTNYIARSLLETDRIQATTTTSFRMSP